MIFVTVGTHEQPFNRLVEHMDKWAGNHDEEVVMQIGFSTYAPKSSKWRDFFSYNEMVNYVNKARIVITHGGPSSFILSLQAGKIPIVVPRMYEFQEHVNNHQVDFARTVKNRYNNIIIVEKIELIDEIIENYENYITEMNNSLNSNNEVFCEKLSTIVNELLK